MGTKSAFLSAKRGRKRIHPNHAFSNTFGFAQFHPFWPQKAVGTKCTFSFFFQPQNAPNLGFFLARFEAPPKPLHPMQTHGIKITKLAKFGLFPSKKILKNCNSPKYIHFFIHHCPKLPNFDPKIPQIWLFLTPFGGLTAPQY